MRGTIHIVTREDRALFSTALGTRVGGMKKYLLRRGLLNEQQYRRLRQAVLDALASRPLDRVGIADRVAADLRGASQWFGSWGGILRLLAQDGLVVFGRPHAGRTTFARVDRWWPDGERRPPADHPLLGLMRRYLLGYGPATAADFAYWSGLTVREGRFLLEKLRDEVIEILIEGKKTYLLRRDLPTLKRTRVTRSAKLLPHFDVFLLGHRDKSELVDPGQHKEVFRSAGWISPTILLDGRINGTWSYERKGSRLLVTLKPFASFPRWARRPLREEAESLQRFLGAGSLTIRL